MTFISASDEVVNKSLTGVENKFITKYVPILEPAAVKVYLYALYLCQNGRSADTAEDMAERLNMTVEELVGYFEYLEEFELVSMTSTTPLEVKILSADNSAGAPKRFKPEKYADFTKNVQSIIKGRMVSVNEFREYFLLIEEYGFEQNALIMIISYCVNLKGDTIRLPYIKKVAKSFADEGVTSAKKVDEKLSAYTSSTPALIRIFKAAGINKQPDIDDDKYYKKWTAELGFDEDGIIAAAKSFKAKASEKIDAALEELYKNKRFDCREIEDYCANKSAVLNGAVSIARALGVYMNNPAPYIDNYVNKWCDCGFTLDCLQSVAEYCFLNGKKSFEDMHEFVLKLYGEGVVSDESVKEYIEKLNAKDAFIKKLLGACGLTRKVIAWDRESVERWQSWNFGEDMLLEAAKLSAQKNNPMAYMNSILSAWKSEGKFTLDSVQPANKGKNVSREEIESHYSALRLAAERRAEENRSRALADSVYGELNRQIKALEIELAMAEIRQSDKCDGLKKRIDGLKKDGERRLKEIKIDSADFVPRYACGICGDTGYDKDGKPCECMKRFINSL